MTTVRGLLLDGPVVLCVDKPLVEQRVCLRELRHRVRLRRWAGGRAAGANRELDGGVFCEIDGIIGERELVVAVRQAVDHVNEATIFIIAAFPS